MTLIADIGATHSRCAIVDRQGAFVAPTVFKNRDFVGLQDLLQDYLEQLGGEDSPGGAALAVAGPVLGDEVRMPNIDWRFSQAALKDELGLRRLTVVNDFAAVAWALPDLADEDLAKIGGGSPVARSAKVTLGPGSGLGIATIAPCPNGWTVVDGEGGNITFSGVTPEQQAVAEHIRAETGHCSAENFLSGPGLANVHAALGTLQGLRGARISPAAISAAAEAGEPLACAARAMFFEVLGAVAGNVALTVGALGGVYIAGGIAPRMLEPLAQSRFRESFKAKGRYRYYLEAIPTYVITDPFPAFRGLRRLLGFG